MRGLGEGVVRWLVWLSRDVIGLTRQLVGVENQTRRHLLGFLGVAGLGELGSLGDRLEFLEIDGEDSGGGDLGVEVGEACRG
jgi:hypothetical protein